MKIAITGHTKGLGLALANFYSEHTVVGMSRSTGFDITTDQDRIVSHSVDCDVFINNANQDFAQQELFDKLFDLWKHDDSKTIVNINSRAQYTGAGGTMYASSKKSLSKSAKSAMFTTTDRGCRIINISPGYLSHMYPDKKNLSTEQLVSVVDWCLSMPQNIEIGELGIWAI